MNPVRSLCSTIVTSLMTNAPSTGRPTTRHVNSTVRLTSNWKTQTSNETSNVTVRKFKLTKSGRTEDNVTVLKQFHLTSWGDDASVPSSKKVFIELLDMVEKWQQQSGNGPITIHCSDGATRCGLLCAASYLLEHMKVEQEVDVFHAVQHIRSSRPQLVTDLKQYRFLYELALEYMAQFDQYANFQ
ncbi:Receptor-type tyrosine-protein phosphatase alpha [Lamellibrachia satsuma]|nr:Receptor-type tyrosine-protein phosphatase alpha [Lamellibrachia satsuma]